MQVIARVAGGLFGTVQVPPGQRTGWGVVIGLALVGFACVWQAGSAHAAFPGANGRIAFVSGRDGNADIYAMDADGSRQTRLTMHAAADFAPAWSPDGTRIAFASERDGYGAIYVMQADGSLPTRLTAPDAGARGVSSPAWSPDGARIAYERRSDRGSVIVVMDVAGGNPRQLLASGPTFQAAPVWSPDGARIVFVGSYPNASGALYRANADGSGLRTLTEGSGAYDWPAWSPDGTTIAFSNDDGSGSGSQLYTLGADGGAPVRLTDATTHPLGALAPAWSPDGTEITFVSRRDGNFEIYVMAAAGGVSRRLTTTLAFDLEPDWQRLRGQPTSPVSRDDCKADGWRRFKNPSFKNQGQCISAVNGR